MLHDFYYFTVLSKKSLDVLNIFLHIGVFHMLKHGILRGKRTCKDKKKVQSELCLSNQSSPLPEILCYKRRQRSLRYS